MPSNQQQQSDIQQRRLPQLADRVAHQRENFVEATSADESTLSHYLHYEDNACFFAPGWLDRPAGGDRARDTTHS
ncbi:hypothetical protein BDW59DRAFT_138381 [Aspergillus cavernicola]|uniref:Uncharacterized protein n=1 Tax=Aspergillus cavernicola TaxID=176166 RepID=A0ABR4J024_9EURO